MAEVMTAPVVAPGAPLDDVMLAMDVVDTLRHQSALVEKELSAGDREEELIARLREIYRNQGIAVPDEVLARGVKALREERFVYKPPERGLNYSLAKAWVNRGRFGKGVIGALAALGITFGAYDVGVRRPAEQARIELAQTLPGQIDTLLADIMKESSEQGARDKAEALAQTGKTAARDGKRDEAREALTDLEALRGDLRSEYTIRIVSRPNEQTGVWRVPTNNPAAQRSYYLIVEAIGPDGKPIPRPIVNETDGKGAIVTKWGQHVSQSLFDQVRRDKADDGIVQDNIMGKKQRGKLTPDWLMPVQPGTIAEW